MGKLFQELADMKAAYDLKLKEQGEAAVKDAFKDLFDAYPELRSVVWTQYTPYFNDGDTCEFSVREFDITINGKDDEDDYNYGESLYDLKRSQNPREVELAKAVRALENELPGDVLEAVFGDHCKIVAKREGFQVDEYEHD